MIAAEALAAGLDTPTLCELAGWPRTADTLDLRNAFGQALMESGIELPDPNLAQRHGLRRLAARLVAGETAHTDLPMGDWRDTKVETAEERSFVMLIRPSGCCLDYTMERGPRTWAEQLRIAALALTSSAPIGPGC
ncbi:hypothetical protein F4556_000280 [Kitasatospora gansuensis]|uniref:Uncharacterized protein n=1 Tax=Kitasatospora gansuensis TaxID=258050 RepID=A0A7W7WFN6_9ACTN|nr:hypothetical protein [Kitasatospora gansuensis]MBB4944745.1 hypothetical protein [Kitasatospora gansuensis]